MFEVIHLLHAFSNMIFPKVLQRWQDFSWQCIARSICNSWATCITLYLYIINCPCLIFLHCYRCSECC